ncbi:HD family phosphohydrolase [Aurantibacter aestuarii]|uniref:Phosphohydrolase n=1 Tax=Aurantibacter aestuarii TaxID=1266046 RepID=A0A2T1N8W7_9FLAO|nr:HDIG domain-containing metalloprotein [Aurantibacter aestuarii]PSG88320.1 phosphohydrolase [Aurantibacter aestuarii]
MTQFFNKFYKNQSQLYKIILLAFTTIFIVFIFPKSGRFKYDFEKGKPWQSENLYAPFNFAIEKSSEEILKEENNIKSNATYYFNLNDSVKKQVEKKLATELDLVISDTLEYPKRRLIRNSSKELLEQIYKVGFLDQDINLPNSTKSVLLISNEEVLNTNYGSLFVQDSLNNTISNFINTTNVKEFKSEISNVIYNSILPNLTYNESLTNKVIEENLDKISPTRGSVEKQTLIISKGEVVEGEKYKVLKSLEAQYESQIWTTYNYYWIVFAYTLLVALALLMLLLFLKKYRYDIYLNNTKVTFIFFNIFIMVLLTTLIINYNSKYIYVIPITILPLVIKAFFDARLGLFTHVITILLLGSIVPNSYEYMFLQIIAGIVTILTVSELYKRANLFISVGQITLVYVIAYFAFYVIHEGSIENLEFENFVLFVLCGLATLFVQPIIYIYEKLFGLVSDVSLLELSDTNTKLLKRLSNEAPGTFHHSLNVANLAEACANEIGANAMLVRVGALYHDIGKINNPTYFTENQSSGLNPHDELSPKESAKIIIDHTLKGIEIAKKYNLPERVIDFIRTHHGTSVVYYFYSKEKVSDPEVDINLFRYPGPIPFSKETAILMMCDSVEAASKSLSNPTTPKFNEFVEKIVEKQLSEGQFLNSNITLKEIQLIKKVLKAKLANIYHLRIEYPE